MTKVRAIAILKNEKRRCKPYVKKKIGEDLVYEALDFAINALEQPSGVEDLIKHVCEQERWLSDAGYSTYNVDIAFKSIIRAIQNMPPVTLIFPKGATNGDMLLSMFDTATVYGIDEENDYITICIDNNFYQKFRYSWWNAQYEEKRGSEE